MILINKQILAATAAATALFISSSALAQETVPANALPDTLLVASAEIPAPPNTATIDPPPIIETRRSPVQKFLSRWLDVQAATISAKYRWIQNSDHVQTTSQMMQKDNYQFRVKLDTRNKYGVVVAAGTGNSFVGSWNTTSVGTGPLLTNRYLKQLYLTAKPVEGLQIDYGSLGIARGQSTEITSYDNDGYVEGQRISVKRPRNLHLDEVTVTYAYLGDLNTPDVFRRFHRLEQSNYHQFLVGKKFGSLLLSADYTSQAGVETVRSGAYLKTEALPWVNAVRFEQYKRVDVQPAYGFAVAVEKKLSERCNFTAGYINVDPKYGKLNSNRFFYGKRIYWTGNYTLRPELSVQVHANQALGNSGPIANHTYLVYVMHYNVQKTLQKVGILP